MSLDLCCKEVTLWRMPEWVAYCCWSNEDGGFEGIRYRYIMWVRSQLQGHWNDQQAFENMRRLAETHIDELRRQTTLTFELR